MMDTLSLINPFAPGNAFDTIGIIFLIVVKIYDLVRRIVK